MQVARVPDRTNFAVAEKTRARHWAENFRKGGSVVVGNAEKAVPAPVAGKDKRRKWLAAWQPVDFRELHQVGVRGDLVPQLVLQSLPGAGVGADGDGAGLRIGA